MLSLFMGTSTSAIGECKITVPDWKLREREKKIMNGSAWNGRYSWGDCCDHVMFTPTKNEDFFAVG